MNKPRVMKLTWYGVKPWWCLFGTADARPFDTWSDAMDYAHTVSMILSEPTA